MSTDTHLLEHYVRRRDEEAFAELVRRHLPVVLAAAIRRTRGRVDLAQEVAQQVFSDLARKSSVLLNHPSLIGWLYRSVRYAAIDAIRTETRRQKLTERASAMSDESPRESQFDWEQVRPWLDAAMDDLRERDREVVLMRYFYNLSFGQIGTRLGLSENTARMRTERSLERLRGLLARRGVTSSAAALALVLGQEACASAPASVAATIAQVAMATGPAHGMAGLTTILLMSKYTVPVVGGLVAAGLTVVVWNASVDGASNVELAALRAEHAQLQDATRPDAAPELAATVAEAYTTQVVAIGERMMALRQQRRAQAASEPSSAANSGRSEVTARGHSDHGIANPRDAALTFAWACDIADPIELARVIAFDPDGRQAALDVLAGMPDGLQLQYPTPEALYGMLLAASCIEAPPPGADMMEKFMSMVELTPNRYASRRAGSDRNFHEYQLTETGWKYIIPIAGVRGLPGILKSETLAKLGAP